MSRRKFSDTISPKPRVRVDENGVIDIAGLMKDMAVQEALAEATKQNTGTTENTDDKLTPPVGSKPLD